MKLLLQAALVLVSVILAAGHATAENRLALVIGNDHYLNIEPLRKAIADAKGYADALREKGFSVTDGYDLSRNDLDAAVATFIETIKPGDTAVFVYSGHGWSDGSQNFIIGVDAPARASAEYLARISIPIKNGATGVLDDLERKGARLKVAIIDACRDNPFSAPTGDRGYGLSRGLAPIEAPKGTFVVFSASAGQSALDRLSEADTNPNGVFTRVFLPLLREDLTLQDAVKESQTRVFNLSRIAGSEQQPAYYDEVRGPACLSQTCKGAEAEPALGMAAVTDAWESADALERLLPTLPEGALKESARQRLEVLRAKAPGRSETPAPTGLPARVGTPAPIASPAKDFSADVADAWNSPYELRALLPRLPLGSLRTKALARLEQFQPRLPKQDLKPAVHESKPRPPAPEPVSATLASDPGARAAYCSSEADKRNLHGVARKEFRTACKQR